MDCCDHNACCGHSNDRIGAEIGMLHNLLRRQMACMTEKTANAANVTGMQAMIVHHLIIHEKQGDIFQKDLENAFQMRRSTATGILQLMEQHGIIRREPVEHDGRLKRLVLTEQARAMDEYITERMQQMEQLLRQGITEDELKGWFAVCAKNPLQSGAVPMQYVQGGTEIMIKRLLKSVREFQKGRTAHADFSLCSRS